MPTYTYYTISIGLGACHANEPSAAAPAAWAMAVWGPADGGGNFTYMYTDTDIIASVRLKYDNIDISLHVCLQCHCTWHDMMSLASLSAQCKLVKLMARHTADIYRHPCWYTVYFRNELHTKSVSIFKASGLLEASPRLFVTSS